MKIINETDKAIEILNKYQFIFDKATEYCSLLDALENLKSYEDTGLEPKDVEDLHRFHSNPIKFVMDKQELYKELNNKYHTLLKMYDKMQNELKSYKDLEEKGLLIKLPCKVGDTVYKVEDYGEWQDIYYVFMPIKCKVELIFVGNDNKVYCDLISIDELYQTDNEFEEIPINQIYLTREEAEKELERLNKLEVEPRYLLEKDSVCYGCQHYEPDEENNCTSPRLCINGNVNDYREDEK